MGRPTLFSDDVAARIVKAVEQGCNREDAAAAAGVSRRTFLSWLSQGRKGDERFTGFLHDIKAAKGAACNEMVGVIRGAAKAGVWQAAAWWLERHDPENWGNSRFEVAQLRKEVAALRKLIEGSKGQT